MTTDRLVALSILIALGVFCAAQIVIIIIHSIKRKARARNMPKKFKIIIIDNETGEELVNRDTDCIGNQCKGDGTHFNSNDCRFS